MQKICQNKNLDAFFALRFQLRFGVAQRGSAFAFAPLIALGFLALCFLAFAGGDLRAQGEIPEEDLRKRPTVGLILGGNLNRHFANFENLPGVDVRTQAPAGSVIRFGGAMGAGFSAGIVADAPLSDAFGIAGRLMFSSLGAPLTATETLRIGFLSADGASATFAEANIGWQLENTLGLASAQILAFLRPFASVPDLRLCFGAEAGIHVWASYQQTENIKNLSDIPEAVFNNLSKSRNLQSGSLPDLSPVQIAAVAGIGYDIPLKFGSTRVMLAPEATYAYFITPVVSSVEWSVHAVRAGVTARFVIPEPPVPPPPPPPPPPPRLAGDIKAFRVDSNGAEYPLIRFRVEETTSKQLYPILPYIFFEQNSAALREGKNGYKRFAKPDPDDFIGGLDAELNNFENRFYNSDMMSVYYDVLNIIGKRLQEKPSAAITIIGCNDGLPNSEKGNQKLSRARAETVRDYLANTWDIDPKRLTVKWQELPDLPTMSVDTLEGPQENRRVEIRSDDPSILEPLFVFDTLSVCSTPKIRVRMKGEAEAGFVKSVMRAYQGSKTLKEVTMDGAPLELYDWNVQDEPFTIPKAEEELNFELELYDKASQKVVETNEVEVEQLNLKKKKALKIKDKTVDVYRLISFPFNDIKMGKMNEEIVNKYVKPYLNNESKVVATGYTDHLGNAEVNQRLSDGRAKSVADALKAGQVTSLGVGARRPLYNNDLPEGRFYNRTVEVRVETPVDYGREK